MKTSKSNAGLTTSQLDKIKGRIARLQRKVVQFEDPDKYKEDLYEAKKKAFLDRAVARYDSRRQMKDPVTPCGLVEKVEAGKDVMDGVEDAFKGEVTREAPKQMVVDEEPSKPNTRSSVVSSVKPVVKHVPSSLQKTSLLPRQTHAFQTAPPRSTISTQNPAPGLLQGSRLLK